MNRSRICRFCAEFRTSEQLTPLDDPSRRIRTKLLRCSQINLFVDENYLLPQNVCGDCVDKLEQSWSFAESVAKIQEKLRERFAEDSLANIKVEEEYSVDPLHRSLTDFDVVVKHEDCSYINTNSAIRLPNEDVDPIAIEQPDFANIFVANASVPPKTEVIAEEMLTDDVVDRVNIPGSPNAVDPNDERQVISLLPTSSKQICPSTVREAHLQLMLPEAIENSVGKSEKDYWVKVLANFRETLNIADEDCNKDGTINEKTHPELLQLSWKTYEWECFKCYDHFADVYALQAHYEIQHNTMEVKYRCSDCHKTYDLVTSLKSHIYLKHRPVLRFCCDHCDKFYWNTSSLLSHRNRISLLRSQNESGKRKGSERKIYCDICTISLDTVASLAMHMQLYHSTNQIICEYCDQFFEAINEKKSHLFAAHADIFKFACDICNERFQFIKRLYKHKKKMHNYFARPVMDILAADDAVDAVDDARVNISIPETCKICDTSISSSHQFLDHMKTHIDKDSYICNLCKKRFKLPSMLKRHLVVHSENEKKQTVSKQCNICELVLPNYAEYVDHMRIHVDGKSFKCNFCEKIFDCSSMLKRHLLCHSSEKRFECDICGKKVSNRDTLTQHMRIHSGEKPYICEHCGKTFRLTNSLQVHQRIHTGIRPYTCEMCVPHHTFTRRGNYCVHMTRYHGIDARIRKPTDNIATIE